MSSKEQIHDTVQKQIKSRATVKHKFIYSIKGIYGVTEKQASAIFDEIANGSVPHITVNF